MLKLVGEKESVTFMELLERVEELLPFTTEGAVDPTKALTTEEVSKFTEVVDGLFEVFGREILSFPSEYSGGASIFHVLKEHVPEMESLEPPKPKRGITEFEMDKIHISVAISAFYPEIAQLVSYPETLLVELPETEVIGKLNKVFGFLEESSKDTYKKVFEGEIEQLLKIENLKKLEYLINFLLSRMPDLIEIFANQFKVQLGSEKFDFPEKEKFIKILDSLESDGEDLLHEILLNYIIISLASKLLRNILESLCLLVDQMRNQKSKHKKRISKMFRKVCNLVYLPKSPEREKTGVMNTVSVFPEIIGAKMSADVALKQIEKADPSNKLRKKHDTLKTNLNNDQLSSLGKEMSVVNVHIVNSGISLPSIFALRIELENNTLPAVEKILSIASQYGTSTKQVLQNLFELDAMSGRLIGTRSTLGKMIQPVTELLSFGRYREALQPSAGMMTYPFNHSGKLGNLKTFSIEGFIKIFHSGIYKYQDLIEDTKKSRQVIRSIKEAKNSGDQVMVTQNGLISRPDDAFRDLDWNIVVKLWSLIHKPPIAFQAKISDTINRLAKIINSNHIVPFDNQISAIDFCIENGLFPPDIILDTTEYYPYDVYSTTLMKWYIDQVSGDSDFLQKLVRFHKVLSRNYKRKLPKLKKRISTRGQNSRKQFSNRFTFRSENGRLEYSPDIHRKDVHLVISGSYRDGMHFEHLSIALQIQRAFSKNGKIPHLTALALNQYTEPNIEKMEKIENTAWDFGLACHELAGADYGNIPHLHNTQIPSSTEDLKARFNIPETAETVYCYGLENCFLPDSNELASFPGKNVCIMVKFPDSVREKNIIQKLKEKAKSDDVNLKILLAPGENSSVHSGHLGRKVGINPLAHFNK